uniref:Temporin-1Lc n=1 Tax=Rana luteiventris TaxID=58176 RepID=TP1C_RANLU|nr:RecName: Full=Temporin-1Lc [Rana luteiventris]
FLPILINLIHKGLL